MISLATISLAYLRSRCHVDPVTGCWLWLGARSGTGYGTICIDGKTHTVHRLALELIGRPTPKGLSSDHLCRVRHCFNPHHLEAVTQRENLMRSPDTVAGKHASKTHCLKGHPFSGDNLIVVDAKKGWRDCRICRRARQARALAKTRKQP